MAHLDMSGYSLAPRNLSSAAEVLEASRKVIAFRRSSREPKVTPRKPSLLEMVKWPDWVSSEGETSSNIIDISVPVVRPEIVHQVYPPIRTIIEITAAFYGITMMDLLSHRRTAPIVKPRQIACYLCKTLTLRSLPEIGRLMGDRHHTTILHAVRRVYGLLVTDERVADEVDLLLMKISDHMTARQAAQ